MMDELTLKELKKHANYILTESQELTDFIFCFDEQSILWLANYIEEAKKNGDISDEIDPYIDVLGAYFGEAICFIFGGTWIRTRQGLLVSLPWDVHIDPFMAVEKQILNGPNESIFLAFSSLREQAKSYAVADSSHDGDSVLGRIKGLFNRSKF